MFFCQSANDMRDAVAKAENFCYTKDVIRIPLTFPRKESP